MECLHHVTEQHSKSIVISIHQPSSEVMALAENNKKWAASPIITLLPFSWQRKHISEHSGLSYIWYHKIILNQKPSTLDAKIACNL